MNCHNTDDFFKVAIVGCGPKGLYGLERLLFELTSLSLDRPVEVHIFNKSIFFGAGDIYRCDQPAYLLMNYANKHINMWEHQSVNESGTNRLSLVDWLNQNLPDHVTPEGYSTRATVGEYLHEGYKLLRSHSPDNVRIVEHQAEVIDLIPEGSCFSLVKKTAEGPTEEIIRNVQHVLLTTGHQVAADDHSEEKINFVYPVEERLNHILPASKVAVKGMGLTFIDVILALTQGRGGEFEQLDNGELKYHASGSEPSCIFPYSKSGLLCIPRRADNIRKDQELKFFNKDFLSNRVTSPPDFFYDLWPVIHAEMKYAYYEVLFRRYNLEFDQVNSLDSLQLVIDNFHDRFPDEERFGWNSLADPLQDIPADSGYDSALKKYLEYTIEEASQGNEMSPLAAATTVWNKISPLFNGYYSFGRLKPESQQLFHQHYAGHLNRIAYGPPLINMKKILAVAQCGIINFEYACNPSVVPGHTTSEWMITRNGETKVKVDYLIDARIPKNNLQKSPGPLYKNLLDRGLIRPFINQNGRIAFAPGCLEISAQGHPVDRDGKVIEQITVSGTPTEGITFDNDTLSRSRNDFVSHWAKRVIKTYEPHLNLVEDEE